MSDSNHSVILRNMLAIIFVFLNAVSIASPVIKNTADDYRQLVSLPLGHNSNTSGPEENQLLNTSFLNHQAQSSVSLKNHNCNANFNCNAPLLSVQKCSNSSIAPSFFLERPGYYIFLFRYTLF